MSISSQGKLFSLKYRSILNTTISVFMFLVCFSSLNELDSQDLNVENFLHELGFTNIEYLNSSNSRIKASPKDWKKIQDSLQQIEGFQFTDSIRYASILSPEDLVGAHILSYKIEYNPIDQKTIKIPVFGRRFLTMTRYREKVVHDIMIPSISDPEMFDKKIGLQTIVSTFHYDPLAEYYIYYQIGLKKIVDQDYLKKDRLVTRSVSCPAADPISATVFTGSTAADFTNTFNNTFKPNYEADHGVIIDDFAWSTSPGSGADVWYFGSPSLQDAFYGAGSGITIPYHAALNEIAGCHSECQQKLAIVSHECPIGKTINDRMTFYRGPNGTCWSLGGPVEVIGAGGAGSELGFSILIFGNMVMDDAGSAWGHFNNLTACNYSTDLGYGYRGGGTKYVTVDWANIVGTPPTCYDPPYVCSTTLPIELIHFGFIKDKSNCDQITIFWETISEVNNDYVELQRSIDNGFWESIEIIDGIGDSQTLQTYKVTDYSPLGNVVYYRLKQVDINQSPSYSNVISFPRKKCLVNSALLIYPNPANHTLFIRENENQVSYTIHDKHGILVDQGITFGKISIRHLSPGAYIISSNNVVKRFIKY